MTGNGSGLGGAVSGLRASRRQFLAGASALGGLAALAACGPTKSGGGGSTGNYVSLVAEPPNGMTRTFNPFSTTARWAAKNTIYEPLMIPNFATNKIDSSLATSYKWSTDATKLTLNLRKGVSWSDGKPFTADDVVFTLKLMLGNSGLVGPLNDVQTQIADVAKVDDQTATVTFKSANSPGLYAVLQQFIVAQHTWSSVKDPTTYQDTDPVGTGPLTTIDSFTSQQYKIGKNPKYWQPIKIRGCSLRSYSGNDQISAEVLAGKIDWGGLVPDPDKSFVAKDPKYNHYWWPRTRTVNLQLNTTKPGLKDVAVRKAISMSIDRQHICDTAYWGKAVPANAASLPEAHFKDWIDQSLMAANKQLVSQDIAAANKLLDNAGYKMGSGGFRVGKDGTALNFKISVPTGFTDWISAVQSIVTDVAKIGIKFNFSTMASDAWSNQVYTGAFDAALFGMLASPIPYEFYYDAMSTETVQPVGKVAVANSQRFGDPQATKLLDQFRGLTQESEQVAVMHQIEQRFIETMPLVPLYEGPDYGLFTTHRFTGFPDAQDPYAPLSLSIDLTPFLVLPHLRPV